MITLDSSLHFILDDNENFHCADSLLTLTTDAYIWHELRQGDSSQNILLLSTSENGIRISVFDSASGQFLIPPKRGFFSFGKQEVQPARITCCSYSPEEAGTDESRLLAKLLSTARGADQKTTLVFTHDAFVQLCRSANSDGISQLNNRSGKCRILIRLSAQPEHLDALLAADFSDCAPLHSAYSWLESVRTSAKDELIPTMQSILGSKLIVPEEEMLNLLLRHAIEDSDSTDTLDELRDQAVYLDVCRRHRVGLLQAASGQEQFTPYSRQLLADKLREPEFRQQLRSRTAALRAKNPMLPLRSVLEVHLPDEEPPFPVYADDLALKAMTLSIPKSCTRRDEWTPALRQIKRSLTAVWNHPRNPQVVDAAKSLCIHAQMAIGSKNWITMEEILKLLKFFSTQICAGTSRNEVLTSIRKDGEAIIQLSNHLHHTSAFGPAEGFAELAQAGIDAADRARLEMLKNYVYDAIRQFDRPAIDDKALSDKILADRNRIYTEIEQNTELIAQRDREKEIQRREDEIRRQYSYGSDTAFQPEDFHTEEINPDEYVRRHMFE